MRIGARLLVPLMVAITTAGCDGGRDTPTSPTRPTVPSSRFVGLWTGSMTDETGTRVLRLTIAEQVDRTLLGTWAATLQDGSPDDNGPASGLLNDASNGLFLTMTSSRSCPPSTAPGVISGTLTIIDNRMSGSVFSFGCTLRSGTIELVKQ